VLSLLVHAALASASDGRVPVEKAGPPVVLTALEGLVELDFIVPIQRERLCPPLSRLAWECRAAQETEGAET